MITVIFPEWMAGLIAVFITLYVINNVLGLVIWYLKRKLNKLRGER